MALGPSGAPLGYMAGTDVASYQGNVDWTAAASQGIQFAYVKATEGTGYVDSSYFTEQYDGSYQAGIIRGAYHFAVPNDSTGAAQADYFVANGGGWSNDGMTLPGMLDIEYNPYGPTCYGLTQTQMTAWVSSFVQEYDLLTGRVPVIYTTTRWWNECTGGSTVAGEPPLAVANYGGSPTPYPAGWASAEIWQYTDHNALGYDGDAIYGSTAQLQALADGNELASGTTMSAGQTLYSADGAYKVVMQADGNLVEYGSTGPVWASGTSGDIGATATLTSDGTLEVISATGSVLWSSGVSGQGTSFAELQVGGDFVTYTTAGTATWASLGPASAAPPPTPGPGSSVGTPSSGSPPPPPPPPPDNLAAGQSLQPGQQIVSPNGSFRVIMQADGNLVEYKGNTPLWASHTGVPGSTVIMQTDGNLVVYSPSHQPLWYTNTDKAGPGSVIIQNDGNFVVYTPAHHPVWASQ